jgi:hypothetical protein
LAASQCHSLQLTLRRLTLYRLKRIKRINKRKSRRRSAKTTFIITSRNGKCIVLKSSGLHLLILLVKAGWRQGRAFGTKKIRCWAVGCLSTQQKKYINLG